MLLSTKPYLLTLWPWRSMNLYNLKGLCIPLPIEVEITYLIYGGIYYIRGYSMPPNWATFHIAPNYLRFCPFYYNLSNNKTPYEHHIFIATFTRFWPIPKVFLRYFSWFCIFLTTSETIEFTMVFGYSCPLDPHQFYTKIFLSAETCINTS